MSSVFVDPYKHQQCMSLWQTEFRRPKRQCMKRLFCKWLLYSVHSPSGSALYWQSRMVKAFVKVWDRTVWHSSHTTWMAHQITLHHNLLFKAQFHSVVEMISLHTGTIWCYIWNSLKVNIWQEGKKRLEYGWNLKIKSIQITGQSRRSVRCYSYLNLLSNLSALRGRYVKCVCVHSCVYSQINKSLFCLP